MLLKSIVLLAPFPPPLAGAHKNSARLLNDLRREGHEVLALQTGVPASRAHSRSWWHNIAKCIQFIRNCGMLFRHRRAVRSVYMVPDGGMGIWLSMLYAVWITLLRLPNVVVQYRNYTFFRTRHPAVQFLVRTLANRATHVFFDESMRLRFTELYGQPSASLILSNAAQCDVSTPTSASEIQGAIINIGYLSNLTKEKGFGTVAEVFEEISENVPRVHFHVGGTPVGPDEERTLAQLRAKLQKNLTYHGQVSGDSKQSFYESLDIFVFPTMYKQEAQPNVIFEALATGASVVSTDYAAIPGMFNGGHSRLIPAVKDTLKRDLMDALHREITELMDAELRVARRESIKASFLQQKESAKSAYSQMLASLAGD